MSEDEDGDEGKKSTVGLEPGRGQSLLHETRVSFIRRLAACHVQCSNERSRVALHLRDRYRELSWPVERRRGPLCGAGTSSTNLPGYETLHVALQLMPCMKQSTTVASYMNLMMTQTEITQPRINSNLTQTLNLDRHGTCNNNSNATVMAAG